VLIGPAVWVACALSGGCALPQQCQPADVPRELKKVSLPPYVIEPPDILTINAVRLVPRPPYRIAALDALGIQVTKTLPNAPIAGVYAVEPDGTVDLGFTYGTVRVIDLTVPEARKAIERHLESRLVPPFEVSVTLVAAQAMQQIRGPHLVRPDGTIGLGVYGSVYVDNLTIPEARLAIEQHLSQFLLRPEIALDVSGFNSKVFYIISDGATYGEQVTRLPITGKTTVLDAVGLVNGLAPVASKHHIWIARPAAKGACKDQTLAVDWVGITQRGDPSTNYQIFPGDRIYVQAQALVTTDNALAKLLSPLERTLGIISLGNNTVRLFLTPIPTTTVTTPVLTAQ
jgi:polysaccharide export outer membrane protein